MKYYLKWITEQPLKYPDAETGESLLDVFVTAQRNIEYDVVYYKKTTSQVAQWIDCMSRATPFDSLESVEKMLTKLDHQNYDGVFGIECSIDN